MSANNLILLFKSTSRNEYKRLLLTALSAPNGTFFWTYYKGEHVSPDLLKKAKRSRESFVGKKVTLIFFNRKDNAQLKFYPLRNFTVQKIESRDAIMEFFLTPDKYYQYTASELQNFNTKIRSQMTLLPPQDRSWAQLFSPSCLDELRTSTNQKAWNDLVEYLDKQEIGEDDFKESIFFYISPLKEDDTDAPYDARNGYSLNFRKRYVWDGIFFKPRETKESFRVKLEGSIDIEPISAQIITIPPGRIQPLKFEFSCKPVNVDKSIEIGISVPEKEYGDAPRHEFPAKIIKLSFFSRIGWEGFAVLLGFVITSLAQTLISPLFIKMPLSIIGNFLSAIGIVLLARKY